MKTMLYATAVTAAVAGPAAVAEHLTMEDLAVHEIQTQNPQQFITEFKQLTGIEFTQQMFKKMKFIAAEAAVVVDYAEIAGTKPAMHDPRHCKEGTCFEQWMWQGLPKKMGIEENAQFTKLIISDMSGNVESTAYCHALIGVVSCTVDVENGKSLKKFFQFSLKDAKRGLVGQLFALHD